MTDLSVNIKTHFIERFEQEPVLIKSPGRVNLVGEHTDYNDGFVLPAAIEKAIVMGMAKNGLDTARAYSVDMDETVEIDLHQPQKSEKHWANYIKGVVVELQQKGFQVKGFDLVFGGDIPIGAGLSSSAALEGGVLTGLDHLFGLGVNKKLMARIGQLTEHHHVGVNCGIMDQFINLYGEADKVLKLDCRSLEYELYPFDRDDIKIVLCNSKVSHNLADSEYNVRRKQCEQGIEILQKYDSSIKNLRDVALGFLNEYQEELGALVYKRCKFVLEENQRVQDACADLEEGDFIAFGNRMFASHRGLSEDYEVSCKELDVLVDIAKGQAGLLGCRMMGGGFGGCTINLVEEDQVNQFTETIKKEYKKRTGLDTDIYVTQISGGTQLLAR